MAKKKASKKKTPATPPPKEMTHRRASAWEKRVHRRVLSKKTAAEAIGPITPGLEVFGLSKGHYSLIDIIEHCLGTTGPADVTISTWTAANADLDFALGFLGDGRIRKLRFVVDFSFPTRQPAYCTVLRERFGDEAIRLTNVHAKFVTIRNKDWNLVIRSSMNLNENRRLESFEISDDPKMADYIEQITDELFELERAGEQFEKTAFENKETLEKLGHKEASEQSWLGDGTLDRDVRRAGLTTKKGGRLK